ncbi:unnamed protein product [Rhizophagus irregularis]|uniref:Uncharacterized protein n=1 Tax=Rhizophagus irregularis TaxID=588596 RepID=A0A915YU92_9GLOM|nr:unnamed protein product [Rhizophagus irregularis]CAB5339059.1 unnamed protein product [Rhizophagus irregularis]
MRKPRYCHRRSYDITLFRYHKCLQSGALADCFGITKDQTSHYMLVMRYYDNDANPSNRPTASKICECLEDWVSAVCDNPNSSDLLEQFDAAEEIKFTNLERLNYNILPCHEKAIYFSRPLDPIINIESST